MLGHLSLGVHDLARSVAFYDALLAPLQVVQVWRTADAVGYGAPGGPDRLALFARPDVDPRRLAAGPGFHLALRTSTRAAVAAAHAAGLAQGGRCVGAPGLRPHYGPTYFAAFLLDPDGHKLEVVASVEPDP